MEVGERDKLRKAGGGREFPVRDTACGQVYSMARA